jgi:hypothetical protein
VRLHEFGWRKKRLPKEIESHAIGAVLFARRRGDASCEASTQVNVGSSRALAAGVLFPARRQCATWCARRLASKYSIVSEREIGGQAGSVLAT